MTQGNQRKRYEMSKLQLEVKANGILFCFPTELLTDETIEAIKSIAKTAEGEIGEAHKKLVRMERRCNYDLELYRSITDVSRRKICWAEYNRNIISA